MIVTTFLDGMEVLLCEDFDRDLLDTIPCKTVYGDKVTIDRMLFGYDIEMVKKAECYFSTFSHLNDGGKIVEPDRDLTWGICLLVYFLGNISILSGIEIGEGLRDWHYLTTLGGNRELFRAEMEVEIARRYHVAVELSPVGTKTFHKDWTFRGDGSRRKELVDLNQREQIRFLKLYGVIENVYCRVKVSYGSEMTPDEILRLEYGGEVYDYVKSLLTIDGVEIAGGLPVSLSNPVYCHVPILEIPPHEVQGVLDAALLRQSRSSAKPVEKLIFDGLQNLPLSRDDSQEYQVGRLMNHLRVVLESESKYDYEEVFDLEDEEDAYGYDLKDDSEGEDEDEDIFHKWAYRTGVFGSNLLSFAAAALPDIIEIRDGIFYIALFNHSPDVDVFFTTLRAKEIASSLLQSRKGKYGNTLYSIGYKVGKSKVQLIKRVYTCLSEILTGFDLAPSQVALKIGEVSGKVELVGTNLFKYALQRRINPVNPNRKSSTFVKRLWKYQVVKGFPIWFPEALFRLLDLEDDEKNDSVEDDSGNESKENIHTVQQLARVIKMGWYDSEMWKEYNTLDWYGSIDSPDVGLRENYQKYVEDQAQLSLLEEQQDREEEGSEAWTEIKNQIDYIYENLKGWVDGERTFLIHTIDSRLIETNGDAIPVKIYEDMIKSGCLHFTDYIKEIRDGKRYVLCEDVFRAVNFKWSKIPSVAPILKNIGWKTSNPESQATGSFDPTANDFLSSQPFIRPPKKTICDCTLRLRDTIKHSTILIPPLVNIITQYVGGAHFDQWVTVNRLVKMYSRN